MIKFSALQPGQHARLVSVQAALPHYQQRLRAMGFRPGVEFSVCQRLPFGGPTVIAYLGTRLCLRDAEANALAVELCS